MQQENATNVSDDVQMDSVVETTQEPSREQGMKTSYKRTFVYMGIP